MSRSLRILGVVATLALAACSDGRSFTEPQPSLATGGGGGGGGGTTGTPVCALVTVTNSGQTVKNLQQPDIKYNLENCGTTALNVTVSVVEVASAWSTLCPSPVAAPVQFALDVKVKLSSSFPTYRGPCGFTGPVNGTLVQGYNRWQGHNLMVVVTNDADGVVLSTSFFSWQDQTPRV